MSLPLKYAFRLVHIDNIPHILAHGIVHATSPNANPDYVPIGDPTVINSRREKQINGKGLCDYIPFYFGPRSPMLFVIQNGYNGVPQVNAEDIVYCVIRLKDIIQDGLKCQFTDGHALNSLSKSYDGTLLSKVDEYIHEEDVYARYWSNEKDIDLKRRKDAELLVEDDLPARYLAGFVVYNSTAFSKLKALGIPETQIVIRPGFYF